ncbi:endosialidase-like protein [Sphingomonas sp. BK235]|nr:endosialidase-like protein [Sphingomonas sp. BK235]
MAAGTTPLLASDTVRGSDTGGATIRASRRGAVDRPLADKLDERVSIKDFGAVSGGDVAEVVTRALSSLSQEGRVTLHVPAGRWRISRSVDWSAYKDVTLRIEPGAVFEHGANTMILPACVETGTTPNQCFFGKGRVATRDRDTIAYDHLPKGWIAYANFAMGSRALASNVSGTNNFAWGCNALAANVSGSGNVAIGNDALASVRGGTVPALGTQTGLGWNNIALGDTALRDCTDGYENLAIGALCLQQTVTGKWNVAVGHNSQILSQAGECNVSLGAYALVTNSGSNNLAIGWAALEAQATGSNIAIGHMAMNANVSGTLNTALGSEALMRLKTGKFNVAVGLGTLTNLVGGHNNTGVGTYALSSALADASENSAFGRDALILLTTGKGNSALGSGALSRLRGFNNCTGLGLGSQVTGHNQIQLGNSDAVPHAFAPLQLRSDARDKTDIRETKLGLDFIRSLRPVDFRWRLRPDQLTAGATPETRSRFHHGLLAQDVRAVIEQSGIDFGGFQDHSRNGGEDVLSLGYEELIAPLIKAIQQLSTTVEELREEVATLRSARR